MSLLRQQWDWIIGSDLAYFKELCGILASLWSLCCEECPSARILYSHTLHRWQDSGYARQLGLGLSKMSWVLVSACLNTP